MISGRIARVAFGALVASFALNHRYLDWKQYVFLFPVGVTLLISYSRAGAALARTGTRGFRIADYVMMLAAFYLASFPVAHDLPTAGASSWLGGPGSLLLILTAITGASSAIFHLSAPRGAPSDAAAAGGVRDLVSAAILTAVLMGFIMLMVTHLPIPDHLKGGGVSAAFLLVPATGIVVFLSGLVLLRRGAYGSDDAPPDYRPAFVALSLIFATYGGFKCARAATLADRGDEAMRRGDLAGAEEVFRDLEGRNAVLRLPGMSERARRNLSEIYRRLGAERGATAAVNRAEVEYALGNADMALELIRGVPAAQMDVEALGLLERLINRHPHFVEGHWFLAERWLERGRLDRAEAAARRILGRYPSHVPSLDLAADALERRGSAADAARLRGRMTVGIEENEWTGAGGRWLQWPIECHATAVLAPGAWRIEFKATATPAHGVWPVLQLKVDDEPVKSITIDAPSVSGPGTFAADFRVARAGAHKIAFLLENPSPAKKDGAMVGERFVLLYRAVITWTGK